MAIGVVKWFDSRKGFGFIASDQTQRDVFVHFSGIAGEGFRKLRLGEQVEFELRDSGKGPQAHNVQRAAARVSGGDRG